ncbi:MAG: tyrosine-type recombinase/integrase, partial [Pirellulales bacterium]
IEPGLLDRFAGWCKDHGISEGVAKKYLGTLETLMRHCRPEDFPKTPTYTRPDLVPRIPQPPAPPESDWTKAGMVQQVNPAWTDWTLRRYMMEQYATTHEMCRTYRDEMLCLTERFSVWLGRQAELSDLNDSTLNRWLIALGETQLSKNTIHNNRTIILSLWHDAFQNCVVQHPPRRVRKIRIPWALPKAWDTDEVRRLLACASAVPGFFRHSRVSKGLFWKALIRVAFETGLRQGDLLLLRHDQIDDTGHIRIIQHKTQNEVLCRIHPETVMAIKALDAGASTKRALMFGGIVSHRRMQQAFRRIVQGVGLVGGVKNVRSSRRAALESGRTATPPTL